MKHFTVRWLAVLLFLPVALAAQPSVPQSAPIAITASETYELANIILALTPYGKQDPSEVYQPSRYYREVRAHFEPYALHPLVAQVNYSRQEWDKFLSFRTDSYAFAFDAQGQLVRQFPFATQPPHHPFDEHLALVADFARTSGFRAFYQRHRPYYDSLATAYQASQRLPEVLAFLTAELGNAQPEARYAIVFSPLVGRMNCHRDVNGVATDFITLPEYLLNRTTAQVPSAAEVASGIHMLFTEMDHGFVNPATDQHAALVTQSFVPGKWDVGSGYEKDPFGTFNEYMTWAVYDLFVHRYFPQEAPQVCQDWAMQNESRGFFASTLFNDKVRELYDRRKKGQTLRSIYPALLKWCQQAQNQLSQPTIASSSLQNATVTTGLLAHYEVRFSEPMQETPTVDIMHVAMKEPRQQKRVSLTPQAHNLRWSDHGQKLAFDLELENNCKNRVMFNVPWTTKLALKSKKGVDLKVYQSSIVTEVKVH
ncbi:MAG TPA: DUF4932 domain-containing protein [Hymenobacter sp.]|jgi:hypothetical protein